jgi:glycerol-3-phosphate acyltransferase PlsY
MSAIAWISAFAAILTAYLLGSVPFGLLIGRARGVDIRKTGSCNIGATNVMRSVGKGWGIFTLLLDALKGYLPAALFPMLLLRAGLMPDAPVWLQIACGCSAILGHNFPLYLRFKGGKGVATSAGVLLGIAPAALLIGLAVFALVFGISRFVSLGSITAAIVIPVVGILLYWKQTGPLIPAVLAVLGALVIWRHKANIVRLRNGTENRIVFRRKKVQ